MELSQSITLIIGILHLYDNMPMRLIKKLLCLETEDFSQICEIPMTLNSKD